MKVAIVGGAGGIGSSLAFNLAVGEVAFDIVVIDSRPNMVTSHVMDLQDILGVGGAASIRGGELSDAADADVVVVSAAVPLRLNASRDVFLGENAALLATIVDPLAASVWGGVLVLMTNPVDPLLTWVHRRTGIPRERLIGYTLNDSLRLRTGIATALGVPNREVDAWVLGEHGAGQVPLFSRVRVAGENVELTAAQRAIALDYIENWYVRHVALDSGRTSTWSSGKGASMLIERLARPRADAYPVATILDGEYGVSGVSLGIPAVLGPSGVDRIEQWPLSEAEQEGMIAAAARIEELTARIEV